jgi:hypothetical protein
VVENQNEVRTQERQQQAPPVQQTPDAVASAPILAQPSPPPLPLPIRDPLVLVAWCSAKCSFCCNASPFCCDDRHAKLWNLFCWGGGTRTPQALNGLSFVKNKPFTVPAGGSNRIDFQHAYFHTGHSRQSAHSSCHTSSNT